MPTIVKGRFDSKAKSTSNGNQFGVAALLLIIALVAVLLSTIFPPSPSMELGQDANFSSP